MPKQSLAIALCRVSSLEQLKNGSLGTQKGNVLRTAEELEVTIPSDGLWEGQVSSKKGVNYNRKDLVQMYDYCKKRPNVKFLIVQEVDRFMRSPDEQTFWYVKFWYELKVKVWFADKPELNEDSHNASLFRYLEGWRAGGSNEERINKSINGHIAALKQGRWTFHPKPGYMKGRLNGVPEIHPDKGTALRAVLLDIYFERLAPPQALKKLNNSAFMEDGHSHYKMDKFRKIVTDPFYAGILVMDRQIVVRNENGLHEPLITIEQHTKLVRLFESRPKTQNGPRKNGNPGYPLSNLVTCELCIDSSTIPRYVGFDRGNGKSKTLVYHKYRCRACGRYLSREELHPKVEEQFRNNPITSDGVSDLRKALDVVWKRREAQSKQDAARISGRIAVLKDDINTRAIAAIDPSNLSIKSEILDSIEKMKLEISTLDSELITITEKADADRDRFLTFAFDFIDNMSSRFLEIHPEDRLKCKQIVFPAGFYLDSENNVYTPEISPLITLQATKKDAETSDLVQMVRVRRL